MAWNFFGKGYGCNSKYIYNYIIDNGIAFELIWAVNRYGEFPPSVKQVKINSLKYFYHIATSRVFIDNQHKEIGFAKRKNQSFIKTWHATLGLKKIGVDNPEFGEFQRESLLYNNQITDMMISNCKYITDKFRRVFLYNGDILECGFPRTDILVNRNDRIENEIRNRLNLCDTKIILYAPTFRSDLDISYYDVNLKEVITSLEGITNSKWKAVVKLHPHLTDKKIINDTCDIIDLTLYDDIQELMAISDILITDYSNIMFEFSLMEKPVFLYCKDYYEYKKSRDYYFDLHTLPFSISFNNQELLENIVCFNKRDYICHLNSFFSHIGFKEFSNSSEMITNKLREICRV